MSTRSLVAVRLLSAIALTVTMASVVAAQSLGDLAKQEAARRKEVKSSGKVLTNDSLRSVPVSSPPPVTPGQSPAPAGGQADAAAKPAVTPDKPKPESGPKTEQAWRERMQAARDALQRSQMFADALQSQINGLTADFTARDDPAQRAVVADNRQKALAELDRVKNDIVQQTKAIADIQSEARRAGVPPGWLR